MQYWKMQQLAGRGEAEQRRLQEPAREGLYYKLFYFVAAVLVMLLMTMSR